MAEANANAMPYLDAYNMAMVQAIGSMVNGRPFHEFSIPEQRELFLKVQSPRPINPGVSVSEHTLPTSHGDVKTFLYRPERVKGDLSFIFYVHGGGWTFGGAVEFEAFIFDIVLRTGLAVVFPEYTLAPEKQFPVQHEQCLEVLQDVLKVGGEHGLLVDKVVLGGDSSGGQLITAISILNHQRNLGLPIVHQLLIHPYTNVMAELTGGIMRDPVWAEQQKSAYFPSVDERSTVLAAPGMLSLEQAKEYMPPTTMIVADQDPFKEQNEAFAKLLQTAGVSCGVVQAFGSAHAVEIFHQARDGPTAKLIMTAIAGQLRDVLGK